MNRLTLGLVVLLMGCDACARAPEPQHLWPRHNVRVLWVIDSAMQKMEPAANDSVEAMFQVTAVGVGQLCPEDVTYAEHDPRQLGTPADSAYLVLGVVLCPAKEATAGRIKAECPNPLAPTIHVHTHGKGFGPTGNTCSPSQPDYAFQLVGRHLFDAIICGSETRPSAWFFFQNPLLGTKDFPDTLTPFSGNTKPLQ